MSLIGKNIVWLLVSQVATWAVTLIVLVVVPNRLGSDNFGTLSFAAGYVGFFTLAAGLGTSTLLARDVGRDHDIVGPYVYNAVIMKVLLVVVLSAAAISIAIAFGNRGDTLALIVINCVGMLFIVINEVFAGALIGMQRMGKPAMWTVVQVYVQSAVGIGVLLLGWGVVAYGAVFAMSNVIPMAACAVIIWPLVRSHQNLDPRVWRLLVVGGIPLLALTALNLIYGTIDIPILHRIAGSEAVGWYTVAYRWVGIPIFIATAVASAFFPALSAHGKTMSAEFAPLVNRGVFLVVLVTVPAALGIALIAEDLIQLIYRNDEYDNSVVLMQILAIHIPLAAMDTILASALVAADRMKRYLIVAGGAAVLNPIACIIAIRLTQDAFDNGAIGAAIVTVGTELWIMIGAMVLKAPGVLDRTTTWTCLRIVAAAATMIPAVLLTGGLPLAVRVAVGVVCYAAASIAFRTVAVADLARVVRQAREAVGGIKPTAPG